MKKYYVTLAVIQLFIALGAIPAGLGYLNDTSGQGMGNSVAMLSRSPLTSFLIPGIILLFVHGFGNIAGAYLSLRRHKSAGVAGMILGFIQMGWIVIQVAWIGYLSFMQPMFFIIGLAEAGIGYFLLRQHQKSVV